MALTARRTQRGTRRGGTTDGQAAPVVESTNALPVPWVEPVDISDAILLLVSDEARYTTGVTLPVDAGYPVQ